MYTEHAERHTGVHMILKMITRTVLGLALGVGAMAGALAQDYPNRPITLVVGYTAGGGVDTIARIVAEKLSANLGQPVLVENRPGVGAVIGASYVAKAKPDGYTLTLGAPGPFVFNYALNAKLPYSPQDFTPIGLVATSPMVLLTQAQNPAKSVADLVAFSKQHPDKANYGSSSAAFQLVTELFNTKTGARLAHIPYKSVVEGITALISGDITTVLSDIGPASAALQSGRVKALAITSTQRLKDLPNVPTFTEQGIDLTVSVWYGLIAPAGTPAAIVKRLNDELAKIVAMPDVQKRLTGMAVIPQTSTPEAFSQLIESEIPMWKKVALDNNIKAQ
jgi:tripartite-type tricarboxylate transporter receptor subunit TctC